LPGWRAGLRLAIRANPGSIFWGVTVGLIFVIAVSLPWLLQQFQNVRVLALQIAGLGDGGDTTPLTFSLDVRFLVSLARALFVYLFGPFPWVFWGIADPVNYLFYPGVYAIYGLFPFFVAGLLKMLR